MARHREPLSQGLWTAEDPGLLTEGQLPVIYNGVYKPGSQALRRAPGWTAFGTVSATAVNIPGLRDVRFDNGNHYLLAHASSNYYSAAVGDTGTFGVLASNIGIGAQLEVVQFRNRYFLFNGVRQNATATAVNSNRVMYLTATAAANTPVVRQHGMNPVESQPTITTAGGGVFSQSATGYYEYWTTEVAQIVQDSASAQIESTFVGKPSTVLVSATSVVPTIQQPNIVNPITTHWRIYRSPKKDAEKDVKFPAGFMIAEVSTAGTAHADTSTTASASSTAANYNSYGDGATVWADLTGSAGAPTLSADNNVYATMVSTGVTDLKQQGCYGFNFGGFTGSVSGITVEIEANVNTGTGVVGVRLCRGRQADGGIIPAGTLGGIDGPVGRTLDRLLTSAQKSVLVTTSTGVKYTLGGPTDRWLSADHPLPFPDSAFTAAGFMVVISFNDTATTTLSVDYLKVTVHYGASIDSVIQFPTVAYTFGDVTAQVGKNGPPPSSSTGDIFEDTLVVNDVSNPSLVRYSYPGDPEAFPATYYLDFETQDNDSVQCIKVVNNRCMVWLKNALYRLNYLPSERDASFDRGKAAEEVSIQHGAVNPMCVAIYSPDGPTQKAAFVSHKGIFATDGYTLEDLTVSLNWRGVISETSTSAPICLINDPENQELLFYYYNYAIPSDEVYAVLHLSYAQEHLINGRPKISGPVINLNYNAAATAYATPMSAWPVLRSNGSTNVYVGYGDGAAMGAQTSAAGAGKVYRVNGSNLPTEYPLLRYRTREMYLADYGNEWRMDELGIYGVNTVSMTVSAQAYYRKTNKTLLLTGANAARVFNSHRMIAMPLRQQGEAIQVWVTASGQAEFAHHFMLIDGTDFGMADPGT